jgi:hypothetical protein
MKQRYNIYFAGQLVEGHERVAVRAGLAKLFNANEQTLDTLFSGKPQLIKKACDKATALKYKQAMERAGAVPLVKLVEDSAQAPQPTPTHSSADRIAALAGAPDEGAYSPPPQESAPPSVDTGSLDLCPDGTEVLRPEERAEPVDADVDISGLELDAAAQRLSEEAPPAPPAPDTGHLSMGEVGETIPTLPATDEPLNPDTDAISLSPEGTDFSDCNPPDAPHPQLDLSAIDLAPEGTDVLTEDERKRRPHKPPPETGHINLAE